MHLSLNTPLATPLPPNYTIHKSYKTSTTTTSNTPYVLNSRQQSDHYIDPTLRKVHAAAYMSVCAIYTTHHDITVLITIVVTARLSLYTEFENVMKSATKKRLSLYWVIWQPTNSCTGYTYCTKWRLETRKYMRVKQSWDVQVL